MAVGVGLITATAGPETVPSMAFPALQVSFPIILALHLHVQEIIYLRIERNSSAINKS